MDDARHPVRLAALASLSFASLWLGVASPAARAQVPAAPVPPAMAQQPQFATVQPPATQEAGAAGIAVPPQATGAPPPVSQAGPNHAAPPPATSSASGAVQASPAVQPPVAMQAPVPAPAPVAPVYTPPVLPAAPPVMRAPAPPAPPTPPVAGLPPDAPKLVLSGGVYSERRDQRVAIVNGAAVREGADLGSGVVLAQITPSGVVLAYHGNRYNVPY